MDAVRRIADTVLYEGYLLWPYRRSALKNRRRWMFGGVYPREYCLRGREGDLWETRTECPLEAGDGPVTVSVDVRFLHFLRRGVVRAGPRGREPVDGLTVAGRRLLPGEEATEREVSVHGLDLDALRAAPAEVPIEIPAGRAVEWVDDPPGRRAGGLVREWRALRGTVTIGAREAHGTPVLTVGLRNTTPGDFPARDDALPCAFASAHVVLRAAGGRFVSLSDPPQRFRAAADECRNHGMWPVLVGEEGARDTVLSAPIVLPDHPRIAPESPGDLFDATEIDQLLTLSILALTDEERQEMRATDPRARAILDRIEAMSPEDLMRLHGTIRDYRPLRR